MVQLPSAASDRGNSTPAFCATTCRFCRMQPASTVMVRLSVSTLRTVFMRVRLSTICVPESSGVEPTARPVLPPWGTMAVPAAQALTTAATSCVLAGRTTARALPRTRRRQSCSQAERSPSVITWAGPTMARRVSSRVVMVKEFLLQGDEKRRPASGCSRGGCSRLGIALAQPHMQRAGGEQYEAQGHLGPGQPLRRGLVAPAAHHAFGEIQPDHQADPAE